MKAKTVLNALIAISLFLVAISLFIGCESPTEPKESFWRYSGPIDEDGIRYGLETSSILSEENFVLLGTLDGLIVLKDYKLYSGLNVGPIWALAGTNETNFWLGSDGGMWIGHGPRIWEGTGLDWRRDVFSIGVESYGVLAGTDRGLFWSGDYGKTWISMTHDKLMSSKITAILVSQRNIFAGSNGDLFFSSNGGDSFVEIDAPSSSLINVISAAPNGNVLIGADAGIYVSGDDGKTWKKTLNYKTSDFAVHNNGVVYAGTLQGNGVYESSDNGKTWLEFETDGLEDLVITALTISGDDHYHLLAGTATKGLFRTTDPIE